MWIAFVIVLFLTPDGRLEERTFRSQEQFSSATECLQQAGRAVANSLPADESIRAFSVICRQGDMV